jgi:hypothetical protein
MLGLSNTQKVLPFSTVYCYLYLPSITLSFAGDGLAFRDFLAANFPNVRNRCVGRAEFSKRFEPTSDRDPYPSPQPLPSLTLTLTLSLPILRQDWVCEASDAIYPLFDAILQYTIETLVLDANILRDSILVRLEMVSILPCPEVLFNPNPHPYFPLTLGAVRGILAR